MQLLSEGSNMRKDFKEILSNHANELERELGVGNIFIGYIDDKGDAHGNIHGDAITALYGVSSMLFKATEKAHNIYPSIITDKELINSSDLLSLYGGIYSEMMKLVKK